MASATKVAIVGLDTSHSIAFGKLMNDPQCPAAERVEGLTVTRCLRFETPFQNKEGLDTRQKQLEGWGIKVTECFDEAVADCDVVMLEINDPAYHLQYFEKVAGLGKPVFLDKPLAGTLADGEAIVRLARKHRTRVWSGSSLPFAPQVVEAAGVLPAVTIGQTFGAMGDAPAGDSLIWYGVHTFEMLQKLMGTGAEAVTAVEDKTGVVAVVHYPNARRGTVEAIRGMWTYGGRVQCKEKTHQFVVDAKYLYRDLLREVKAVFAGGPAPVDLAVTFEGLAIMIAARQSIQAGGKTVPVAKLSV